MHPQCITEFRLSGDLTWSHVRTVDRRSCGNICIVAHNAADPFRDGLCLFCLHCNLPARNESPWIQRLGQAPHPGSRTWRDSKYMEMGVVEPIQGIDVVPWAKHFISRRYTDTWRLFLFYFVVYCRSIHSGHGLW